MSRHTYTNNALEAACEAIEEWELTPEEEAALVENLLGELQARRESRNEAAYAEAYDPERLAGRGEAYRRNMIAAGRGRQLG